ncbi:tigger transposable element-derived protein [Elysia marginata]|uniref:Tigger transposable element-derived protein n=1 Tax=Elysia marginata TaxID=1093978 RepID=A0AAV4IYW0_9GAST|nr:tigger transposable element-derived protein [Elysia marginata]
MLQHPGKNITIYNIAALINEAGMKAATPHNITSGFRVSGIWPINEFVFEEKDYLPARVTDRPVSVSEQPANDQPVCEHDNEDVDQQSPGTSMIGQCDDNQSTSGVMQRECASSDSTLVNTPRAVPKVGETSFTSPAVFKGYPKMEVLPDPYIFYPLSPWQKDGKKIKQEGKCLSLAAFYCVTRDKHTVGITLCSPPNEGPVPTRAKFLDKLP